jgi:hypothetical protein
MPISTSPVRKNIRRGWEERVMRDMGCLLGVVLAVESPQCELRCPACQLIFTT